MTSLRWLTCSVALAGLTMAACGGQAAAPTASPAAASKPATAASAAAASGAAAASAKPAAQTSASASATGPKMVLGYSNITANSLPTWAAGEGGYYQKRGLNIDL